MKKKNQQGSLLMLIVPLVAVVLLGAIAATWWFMKEEKKPTKVQTTTVSADEALTSGNTNQNLSQDVQILAAGTTRDGSYVSATDTALNDQAQTVVGN